MDLTGKQLRFLRSKTHGLEARIAAGKKGLTDDLVQQLDDALGKSELVKIRLPRHAEIDLGALAGRVSGAVVQQVGKTVVFYRPFAEPGLKLPQGE